MKILFFIAALANVVLFMWEYKTGAFDQAIITEQTAAANRERIYLVTELPDRPDVNKAARVSIDTQTDVKAGRKWVLPSILEAPYTGHSVTANTVMLSEVAHEVSIYPVPKKRLFGQKIADIATPSVLSVPKTSKAQAQVANKNVNAMVERQPTMSDSLAKRDSAKTVMRNCYEAGPFEGKSAYGLWLKRLNVDKNAIKSVTREGKVIHSYQVYYPAAETLTKSEANVQMLREQGVTDLYLLRGPGEQGDISLGVFKTEHRALLMQSQMLAKGIQVAVKPKFKQKLLHYALITDKGDVMARLNVLKKNYPEMSVKKLKSCSND